MVDFNISDNNRGFKTQQSIERKTLLQQSVADRFKQSLRIKDSAVNMDGDSKQKLNSKINYYSISSL